MVWTDFDFNYLSTIQWAAANDKYMSANLRLLSTSDKNAAITSADGVDVADIPGAMRIRIREGLDDEVGLAYWLPEGAYSVRTQEPGAWVGLADTERYVSVNLASDGLVTADLGQEVLLSVNDAKPGAFTLEYMATADENGLVSLSGKAVDKNGMAFRFTGDDMSVLGAKGLVATTNDRGYKIPNAALKGTVNLSLLSATFSQEKATVNVAGPVALSILFLFALAGCVLLAAMKTRR